MENLNEIINEITEKYEEYEIIDILNNRCCIGLTCDIDEHVNLWAEYMMEEKGYSFIELMNMCNGEEYLNEDYNYIILDTDYNYPRFEAGFNYIDDLLEYVLDMEYVSLDAFGISFNKDDFDDEAV